MIESARCPATSLTRRPNTSGPRCCRASGIPCTGLKSSPYVGFRICYAHLQLRWTMKSAWRIAELALLVAIVYVFQTSAQQTQRTARPSDQDEQPTGGTMRPVIRGTHAAVSSMKPEATRAAETFCAREGTPSTRQLPGRPF